MQSVWDVENNQKNTAKYLAVLDIFLNTHHLNNPSRPRLPSTVEQATNMAFFSDRQTIGFVFVSFEHFFVVKKKRRRTTHEYK